MRLLNGSREFSRQADGSEHRTVNVRGSPPERAATTCQSESSTSIRAASSVRLVVLTSWHSARSSSRRVPCGDWRMKVCGGMVLMGEAASCEWTTSGCKSL